MIEYDVEDRDGEGELIALLTTITGWQAAPTVQLANPVNPQLTTVTITS